jgi:putative oxidoreductase
VALAVPFWRSGLTKWDGFLQLSDSARYLFAEEFRLHIFGRQIPYPVPGLFAHLSGIAEVCLPVLLVLGLGTRLAAAALLGMTAIIQLTEPDGWANFHLPWAAMAFALVVSGPGRVALDRWIARRWSTRSAS